MLAVIALLVLAIAAPVGAVPPLDKPDCVKIQDGVLTYSVGHYLAGQPLTTGFDAWGYNYQAHMFSGSYANAYLGGAGYPPYTGDDASYLATNPGAAAHWAWPYRSDNLLMQWSNEWLANVDCNEDGKLDRGLVDNVVGGTSLGWLTNHLSGDYTDANGDQHYTDFVKIVWTGPDSPLWGQYTIIQEVWNDSGTGDHGLYSKVGAPGFGLNDHWTKLL